jgi:hypothetical protein
MSDLIEQILNLSQGDHLCLFYDEDPSEQMPALVPFIQDSLRRRHRIEVAVPRRNSPGLGGLRPNGAIARQSPEQFSEIHG